jgi:hypothetical protein
MIKNVDFVSIPVADQKRALAFYTSSARPPIFISIQRCTRTAFVGFSRSTATTSSAPTASCAKSASSSCRRRAKSRGASPRSSKTSEGNQFVLGQK